MANTSIKESEVESIATITLSRSANLNSFNSQMAAELLASLQSIGNNKSIRVVILKAEGKAFCAGQDLDEVKDHTRPLNDIVEKNYNPIVKAIYTLEKPILCLVQGVAAGAGANIALACDFVIASESAAFIQAFSSIGLVPDSGGTFTLPKLIGLQKAKSLMMLGQKLSAKEALEIGLIHSVVANSDLQSEGERLAKELASKPPLALSLTKRLLHNQGTLEEQLALEAKLQGEAGSSRDYKEGVAAFLEKRRPTFTGE